MALPLGGQNNAVYGDECLVTEGQGLTVDTTGTEPPLGVCVTRGIMGPGYVLRTKLNRRQVFESEIQFSHCSVRGADEGEKGYHR